MAQYLTSSEEETKKLAQKLAKIVRQAHHGKNVFALFGELGAGKTTFIQGFAKGLGIKEKIISPTFVLIRQHQIPNTKKVLYHIDLYRIGDEKEIKNLGLADLINNSDHLILIEWADKIKRLLSKSTVRISIKIINATLRKITILF